MPNKEVATTQENALSTNVSSGSFSDKIDASDIIIPKILLMQAISQLVEQEKAKAGDFVHSLDETVIGSKEKKPIEFIVLGSYKTIQVYEGSKYIKTTDFDPSKPWEEIINGVQVYNKPTTNFYCLLSKDVENMTVFPHVITFKGNSHKSSKKLNTKLVMLEEFGAEIYHKTFNLVAKPEENDKGKYYILDILDGRKSNDVEIKQAEKWAARLKTDDVQVHESESETADEAGPAKGDANVNF